jgi:integrase
MSIVKRGNIYWAIFTTPQGQRIRKSTGTADKRLAQELHDKLKTEVWRVANLGEKPKYQWQDAVKRWLQEKGDKRSIRDDKRFLCWLDEHLYNVQLIDINRHFVENLIQLRLKEGITNATANRTFSLLRAILNRAKNEWEWLDKVPKVRMLSESPGRDRTLSQQELKRLLAELPAHLRSMCIFALATGLRLSNITGLQWQRVNLEKEIVWIVADDAKAGKPIGVPLNNDALSVLKEQLGKHVNFVFTFRGKPIACPNGRAWRNALMRAGIKNFRWHDLRHTWATHHVTNGTPPHVLQQLGGWSSYKSMQNYAHLYVEHTKEYTQNAELVNTL